MTAPRRFHGCGGGSGTRRQNQTKPNRLALTHEQTATPQESLVNRANGIMARPAFWSFPDRKRNAGSIPWRIIRTACTAPEPNSRIPSHANFAHRPLPRRDRRRFRFHRPGPGGAPCPTKHPVHHFDSEHAFRTSNGCSKGQFSVGA